MRVEIVKTRVGVDTAKVSYFDYLTQKESQIYLCSRVNPIKEAEEWANNVYEQDREVFVIYGLGMGYHIKALLDNISVNQKVYVLDACVGLYKHISNSLVDLGEYEDKVEIHITQDINFISQLMNGLSDKKSKFIVYKPCMQIVPYNLKKFREILESYRFKKVTQNLFSEEIKENYIQNERIDCRNISEMYGTLKNKPLIIVSAGPSLDLNVDLLKDIKEDIFIFSTGRTLKMLLEKKIKVDMFCITDPQEKYTSIQIEGVEKLAIPMTFLNSTSYETVNKYKGPKYKAYSMDSETNQLGRIESGGSVATAMLDLAIRFGANPIVFIGQDLAYTNNKSHSLGAKGFNYQEINTSKKVKGIKGNYIPTIAGFLEFKYWIEKKILDHPEIKFFNCTEDGAYIEGCEHIRLQTFLESER